MTFIANSNYGYFSRVDHRPPQAEISALEMVSHMEYIKKTKQTNSNYLCVSCSANHPSVNIHSCLFTQKGKGSANILSYTAGCANEGKKERLQLLD